MNSALLLLLSLSGTVFCASTLRSKRQAQVLYLCGQGGGQYVSQYPCSSNNGGCQNSCTSNGCTNSCTNNNGIGNGVQILPTSFYNPGSNCNSRCGNVNCNNYNRQWINGQFVAVQYSNNQYSPCATSCCPQQQQPYYNAYNNQWNNNNNQYQFNQYPIGQGVVPNGGQTWPIGQGAVPNAAVNVGTINNHPCQNGRCPTGYTCLNNRCVHTSTAVFKQCDANQQCETGYACGPGNLCYQEVIL